MPYPLHQAACGMERDDGGPACLGLTEEALLAARAKASIQLSLPGDDMLSRSGFSIDVCLDLD